MANAEGPVIARFGSLALDTTRRELTRDGLEVHLTPKAYELLVREAPRVIRRASATRRRP